MKVLIAARLSRLHSGETGLDSQESEVIRWAEHRGHEVVGIAADHKTGKSHLWERKNLRPWVTEPERLSQYDAIVALKVDRLTRADDEGVDALKAWARKHHKTLLISSADVMFPSEGMDGARWDMYIRMAHQEWLEISERYQRMMAAKHEAGSIVGPAPWGYEIVKSGNIKVLVATAQGRLWVPRIFAWAAEGRTSRWIGEQLEAADVSGATWHESRIAKLIKRPTYSGRRTRKGRTALGVEALVTTAIQEQAIAMLASRARLGASGTVRPKALLARLRCGHPDCPGAGAWPMYRFTTTKRGVEYAYYRCSGGEVPERKTGCGAPMISLPILDSLVINATEYWDSKPYVFQRYVQGNDAGIRLEQLRLEMAEAIQQAPSSEKVAVIAADYTERMKAVEEEGSIPPHWEDVDSGMTEGEHLRSLGLDGQRAYLARKDIRAWQIGKRVHVTVDSALARKGGRSALSDS